jgi:hypothetical protein
MQKLLDNCRRKDNRGKQPRKNIRSINENKIVQRASVADDLRHLAAETAESLPVAEELFGGVFEFNAAAL